MPDLRRAVGRVRALLSEDWRGAAGQAFRKTVDAFSSVATKTLPPPEERAHVVAEGIKRAAIGKLSREHAEAVKHYAEEENVRIEAEFHKRTFDGRVQQEHEKTEQEEIRTRMMRTQEMMGRIELVEKLHALNLMPVWDAAGNMTFERITSLRTWEEARARLLTDEQTSVTPHIVSGVGSAAGVASVRGVSDQIEEETGR